MPRRTGGKARWPHGSRHTGAFGTMIPDDVEIRVSDSTAMVRYLVLPQRPAGTADFSEEQLAALVTRDAMIGVVPVTIETRSAL